MKDSMILLKNIKSNFSKGGPILALILLCIFLAFSNENFLTVSNLMNVTRQAAVNGFLSLGMMVCILTAGIDLSIGFTMTLSSVIMAICAVNLGWNPFFSLLIGLLSGSMLGLVNGLLLTKCKLPHPFISTMGTQNIYKGIALVITGATPIAGMPYVVKWAGASFLSSDPTTFFGKIPVSFILMLITYVLFSIFLNYSTLGRHVYAVGGNMTTAGLSGINVDFVRTSAYVISGFMAACGGIILTGRTDSAYPLSGLLLENDAIAAVVIGGTSFFGGKGNVLGTFSGVLLISVLRNGLNLLNVNADMQTIAIGAVIIIAVFIDVIRNGGFAKVKRHIKAVSDKSLA
ncbi:ABC transporter permease [Sinanaerobacter chloroacetimidivorans]|jgi:ribose transport system permease protein|uniref:ABC transporter permease n=1 Tax=Sinanaerobacter chloroacetimidivorans TaxID=2818044 RepID=A0A8J7VXQ5_9FIRM|nr:ABC transporter permease [Sinanaerobacter chloroacetimidivorans]MBR0596631.1 ABC transporter permease [Sinanaerobacter chloroacetimidivorans]